MNCLYNTRMIPLPSDCYCRYLCGAFDGNNYYFCIGTDCDGRVDIYGNTLEFIRSVTTCRVYCALTFDPVACCFWAAACNMPARLYKLDLSLREIDSITVIRPDTFCVSCGSISGVSYNCGNDTLIVAFYDAVWEINKNGSFVARIIGYTPDFVYTDVLSVYPYTIITMINVNSQIIIVLDGNNIQVEEDIIPTDFQIENIIFNPCAAANPGRFYALVSRYREYSQLLRLRFFPELVPAECNFAVCNTVPAVGLPAAEAPAKSPRGAAKAVEVKEPEQKALVASNNTGEIKALDTAKAADVILPAVREAPGDKPETDAYSKCDILLEALTEMEAVLTDILTAEGEKLRRVINENANAAELAAANKSIDSIVVNIANLEESLCGALNSITKLYELEKL